MTIAHMCLCLRVCKETSPTDHVCTDSRLTCAMIYHSSYPSGGHSGAQGPCGLIRDGKTGMWEPQSPMLTVKAAPSKKDSE